MAASIARWPYLEALAPPDVMNHNLETIATSLQAGAPGFRLRAFALPLRDFKAKIPQVPTKSGLMVGLGETDDPLAVMRDMREHNIDMLTIGQYLQPSKDHCRCCAMYPDTFAMFEREAYAMGFKHAAVGAMVVRATTQTGRRTA